MKFDIRSGTIENRIVSLIFDYFQSHCGKKKNCIDQFSKIKRCEFSTYFYDFLFFIPSSFFVSSRFSWNKIRTRVDVGERKFCKRGIKFDRGSKKEEEKKKKKKERMVNNEIHRWMSLKNFLNYYGARCNWKNLFSFV